MSAPVSRLLTGMWNLYTKGSNGKHPKEMLVHPEIFEAFSNEIVCLTREGGPDRADEGPQLKLKSCTMRPDVSIHSVKFVE